LILESIPFFDKFGNYKNYRIFYFKYLHEKII
jgi:hypothetical protein